MKAKTIQIRKAMVAIPVFLNQLFTCMPACPPAAVCVCVFFSISLWFIVQKVTTHILRAILTFCQTIIKNRLHFSMRIVNFQPLLNFCSWSVFLSLLSSSQVSFSSNLSLISRPCIGLNINYCKIFFVDGMPYGIFSGITRKFDKISEKQTIKPTSTRHNTARHT